MNIYKKTDTKSISNFVNIEFNWENILIDNVSSSKSV